MSKLVRALGFSEDFTLIELKGPFIPARSWYSKKVKEFGDLVVKIKNSGLPDFTQGQQEPNCCGDYVIISWFLYQDFEFTYQRTHSQQHFAGRLQWYQDNYCQGLVVVFGLNFSDASKPVLYVIEGGK